MQSLLRGCLRAGNAATGSRISCLRYCEIKPLNNTGGSGLTASTGTLQHVASYSNGYASSHHLKCRPQSFPFRENGLLNAHIVIFPSSNNPSFRCMTTVEQPDASLGEQSTITSPDADHPQRIKFKRLDKTARHIMNILDKEAVEKVHSEREIADIRPGCIVQLKVEVPENKRRVTVIKGIVIARRNAGLNTTFRLRRLVAGVGVESVFPLYSPNIREMKVLDRKKVRRAKLYYLRDRMNALKK